jgi:hypothetical protein
MALVGLLVVTCGAYAAANDIGGVKTGLPLATQRAAIEKINPKYKFGEIKNAEGKVMGLEGLAMGGKYNYLVDQFVALQDDAGNVWYLARAQRFETEAYIPLANYVSALKDKYGTATSQNHDGSHSYWSYDRNGAAQAPKTPSACPISIDSSATEFSKMREDGIGVPIPNRIASNCGVNINAILNSAGNNLIRGSTIVIVNHKLRYDELARQQAQADAAKQKGLDAVKDNKPKL